MDECLLANTEECDPVAAGAGQLPLGVDAIAKIGERKESAVKITSREAADFSP
jgi:hypothetical protein